MGVGAQAQECKLCLGQAESTAANDSLPTNYLCLTFVCHYTIPKVCSLCIYFFYKEFDQSVSRVYAGRGKSQQSGDVE